MSKQDDRREAALRERLEIAGKATKGPWAFWEWKNGVMEIRSHADPDEVHVCRIWHKEDGEFLRDNSPREVRADIEEILRLRAENERLALENQRLSVDGVNGEAYLLTCLDVIRRAVGMPVGSDWQQVAERVGSLNKEADWLAERLNAVGSSCPDGSAKGDCGWKGWPCTSCFREAARKTVEEATR